MYRKKYDEKKVAWRMQGGKKGKKEMCKENREKKSFFMLLLLLQSEKETERKLIFRRSINPAKKLLLMQHGLKCFFKIGI